MFGACRPMSLPPPPPNRIVPICAYSVHGHIYVHSSTNSITNICTHYWCTHIQTYTHELRNTCMNTNMTNMYTVWCTFTHVTCMHTHTHTHTQSWLFPYILCNAVRGDFPRNRPRSKLHMINNTYIVKLLIHSQAINSFTSPARLYSNWKSRLAILVLMDDYVVTAGMCSSTGLLYGRACGWIAQL